MDTMGELYVTPLVFPLTIMANRRKGRPKKRAAKKGHKRISHRKSAAGSRKAAWARWGKKGKKKK